LAVCVGRISRDTLTRVMRGGSVAIMKSPSRGTEAKPAPIQCLVIQRP